MIWRRIPILLPILVFLLPACTTLDEGAVFDAPQLTQLFVTWREAERRRDVELAEEVLYFESSSHRTMLEKEFAFLEGKPGGQVKAADEVHLVGHPDDWGPGDYLFLEPDRGRYIPTPAQIVQWDEKPCIVYEPPVVSAEEQVKLGQAGTNQEYIRRHIAFWQELEGEQLSLEVDRLRAVLRYQCKAQEYARQKELPLEKFRPDPSAMLLELSPLNNIQARAWFVARLRGSP